MTDIQEPRTVDRDRLEELTGRLLQDASGALAVHLGLIGDRLGLFTALSAAGTVTAGQLAERTGLAERYLRDWLLAMAASGYVTYVDGGSSAEGKHTARYRLSAEQEEVFTRTESPAYMAAMFQNVPAGLRGVDRLTEVFRTGEGIAWHEQHEELFPSTERFFAPGYRTHLVGSWIPALTGVEARLTEGGRVADVGCGFGTSTILMAEAFPRSTFLGVDFHGPSIEAARERAATAGLAERVDFTTTSADDLDGSYDLVAFFDCLHDMPDPMGALRAARAALAPGGRVMLVEPMSWDSAEESLTPLGRLMISASIFVCLPSGLSGPPAYGMGSQPGPTRILRLAEEAGFSDARIAASTESSLVFELAAH